MVFLALFVGSGGVADDLRTRALPLYLVRPITPFDYFLGKWLVPVLALALHVLVPGLLLVLLAGAMRPSGETLSFLAGQVDIVGVLLLHFAVVAVTYSSLVVLVSTWSRRRVTAIVLGAVLFIGGGIVGAVGQEVRGAAGDFAQACALPLDGLRILYDGLGDIVPDRGRPPLPSRSAAFGVAAGLFLACAAVVLRRARTSEVVS